MRSVPPIIEVAVADVGGTSGKENEAMEKDPVCGMSVDPKKAAAKVWHGGKTYYFCSHDCHAKFMANPQAYAK